MPFDFAFDDARRMTRDRSAELPASPRSQGLRRGDLVFTIDNFEVGEVGCVREDRFQLVTPDGLRWAPRDSVFTRADGVVRLICLRSGLVSYLQAS